MAAMVQQDPSHHAYNENINFAGFLEQVGLNPSFNCNKFKLPISGKLCRPDQDRPNVQWSYLQKRECNTGG